MPTVRQDVHQEHALHGYRIQLQCSDPDFLMRSRVILEYHGAMPVSVDGQQRGRPTVIDIGTSEVHVPPAAHEVARHESGLCILHYGPRVYLRRGRAVARLDFSGACVDIGMPDAGRASANTHLDLYLLLTFVVLLLLQRRELYAVHAAGLCRTPESPGVLIIAESDSGKSTLTMNLIRLGWHFLTDDSVMLRLRQDDGAREVEALPLRRDFALDPDAADLFPDLPRFSEPLFTDPNKWRVSIDEMFPGQQVDQCIPQRLVFPTLADRAESELVPLKPKDALLRLMNQSSFLAAAPDTASEHLEVLRTLIDQSDAYHLLAGTDIKRGGSCLSELFASL